MYIVPIATVSGYLSYLIIYPDTCPTPVRHLLSEHWRIHVRREMCEGECSIGVDVRDGAELVLTTIVAHVVMGCIVLGRQMKINIHSWLVYAVNLHGTCTWVNVPSALMFAMEPPLC